MINLTPHAINVQKKDGSIITFEPSGVVARVETVETVIGTCEVTGVDIVNRTFGKVYGLPENGESCIVSAMVAGAVQGMPGVFAPDSGSTAIRQNGQIVAVTRLIKA